MRVVRPLAFLVSIVAVTLSAARGSDAQPSALNAQLLWYSQPAAKWEEALPVGNGRMGAMVFGGTANERIQFNEDTLWTGRPRDYARAGAVDDLPELRRLVAAGTPEKVLKEFVRTRFLGDPTRQAAYQPFGDLRLAFPGHEKAINYRRELDLDTGIARTIYEVDGVTFTREIFASYPDNVIVVRLAASEAGKLHFSARLDSPHKDSQGGTRPPDGLGSTLEMKTGPEARFHLENTFQLILNGRVQTDGVRFESRLTVVASGGTTHADEASATVDGANSATLILAAATSFRNWQDISTDPAERCEHTLAAIEDQSYDKLRSRHVADHQRLFRRVKLELGGPTTLPTDERLRRVRKAGNVDSDTALAALFFQYGRYLLIASSRPGSQPANLQGVWNELLDPPWESKWTTNINVEMNYWPAEVTNLSECHQPLFALIDDLVVSGRRTAQAHYGARGWVLHHNTDLWRGTAPINNIDGVWPTGAAWLCEHLWEHWLFSGDRTFLERAYPAMQEAALFFVDTLVKDPRTGWMVTTPAYSPEQGSLTAGPTMDNQLIRSLFNHVIAAAHLLGRDTGFAAQLTALRAQLPPNQVGQHGQLQEWLDDVDKPNNAHRHMSPLWALYPGNDITPADPTVFDAAKILLKWRGDGSTGWSYAWRAPLWARVGDGDMAYRQLSLLLAKRTLPNLFDLCGPFQIDGNFGFTAGVAEMLLQSHQRGAGAAQITNTKSQTPNDMVVIELLPALPKAWPEGKVSGLRARDGFEVDLEWKAGALAQASVRSNLGRPAELRCGTNVVRLNLAAGEHATFDGNLQAKQ